MGGIEVGDLDAKVGNFVRSQQAGYPLREFPGFHKETGPFFEKKRLKFGKNSGLTSPDLDGNVWFTIGCISTYSLLTM